MKRPILGNTSDDMQLAIDFEGHELDDTAVELVRALGGRPVHFEPIGDTREATRRRVRRELARTTVHDELTAKAQRWLDEH